MSIAALQIELRLVPLYIVDETGQQRSVDFNLGFVERRFCVDLFLNTSLVEGGKLGLLIAGVKDPTTYLDFKASRVEQVYHQTLAFVGVVPDTIRRPLSKLGRISQKYLSNLSRDCILLLVRTSTSLDRGKCRVQRRQELFG